MNQTNEGQEINLTAAQVATLARIGQSFHLDRLQLRSLEGHLTDHQGMIAASMRVHSEEFNSSAAAEWIIRADGEVLSRTAAAAEPGEWLRPGEESV
jgi:hypothetical protein